MKTIQECVEFAIKNKWILTISEFSVSVRKLTGELLGHLYAVGCKDISKIVNEVLDDSEDMEAPAEGRFLVLIGTTGKEIMRISLTRYRLKKYLLDKDNHHAFYVGNEVTNFGGVVFRTDDRNIYMIQQ